MRMYMNKEEWIKRCDTTETYAFMEALEEFEDLRCEWSSNEMADYLMKYMGGIKSTYHLNQLMNLCYDITDVELYAN